MENLEGTIEEKFEHFVHAYCVKHEIDRKEALKHFIVKEYRHDLESGQRKNI